MTEQTKPKIAITCKKLFVKMSTFSIIEVLNNIICQTALSHSTQNNKKQSKETSRCILD